MLINTSIGQLVLLDKCPLLDTTERLEFLTDIHQSFNGQGEERIPLRDEARQSFNYNMLAYRAEIAPIFAELHQNLRQQFLVPQMLESVAVAAIDGDFIAVDTSLLSTGIGSFLLIKYDDGQDVVEITAIDKTHQVPELDDNGDPILDEDDEPATQEVVIHGFVINTEIDVTNATIVPLRRCIIVGDADIRINGLVMLPSLNLMVLDNWEYPIAYTEPDLPILLNGDYVDMGFTQNQVINDGGIGVVSSHTNWLSAKKRLNLRILMKNRQEYFDIKRWFYRRRGRLNEFSIPMFEGNHAVKVSRTYRLDSDAIEFKFLGKDIVETVLPLIEL